MGADRTKISVSVLIRDEWDIALSTFRSLRSTKHLGAHRPARGRRGLITLDDVSKRYPNGTEALRDIDLHIGAGEFVFIVGSSGAGKSTLNRLLIREELPTSGRVVIDGQDVTQMKRSQVPFLRRKVGVVFQDLSSSRRRPSRRTSRSRSSSPGTTAAQ